MNPDAAATTQTVDMVYLGVMIASAVFIPIWLLRIPTKGASAYLMASAFAALGALAWAIRADAPLPFRITLMVVMAGCLLADVVVRSARQAREADARRSSGDPRT